MAFPSSSKASTPKQGQGSSAARHGLRSVNVNFDHLGAGEIPAGSSKVVGPGVTAFVSPSAPVALVNIGAGDQYVSGVAMTCTVPDGAAQAILAFDEPCSRAWVSLRLNANSNVTVAYYTKKVSNPPLPSDEPITVHFAPVQGGQEVPIAPTHGELIWAIGFAFAASDLIDNIYAVS